MVGIAGVDAEIAECAIHGLFSCTRSHGFDEPFDVCV
jgi:hypothetical protein